MFMTINWLKKLKLKHRANNLVNWKRLIHSSERYKVDNPVKNVLLATSLGDYEMGVLLESTLSYSLTIRNAKVDVLLCDRALPACQSTKIQIIEPAELVKFGPVKRCDNCVQFGKHIFTGLDIDLLYYSEFISPDECREAEQISIEIAIKDIASFKYDGIAVGEHAYAGALRYYARGDLNGEEYGEQVLRSYLKSAILTSIVLKNILTENAYDVACFHHGIYVPQGIIGEVCRKMGVRVVTWNPAYRKNTFIFSHHDTYHHTMISEPISTWLSMTWNDAKRNKITNYLKSRRKGSNDWIWFHDKPIEDKNTIRNMLQLDDSKPVLGLFTNVFWDAQLHYESNAFVNMLEWVIETIKYFISRTDIQLVVRIHPAEIRGQIPSRQLLEDEINKEFIELPNNIKIISPDNQISTYALMELCNAVTIYNTKTGIEVASSGIPVIVAGEAWIRGKGFCHDVASAKDYFDILDSLPFKEGMTKYEIELALKYAYHFFFRRMIDIPFVVKNNNIYRLEINNLNVLSKNATPGLDLICDGILNGVDFVQDI